MARARAPQAPDSIEVLRWVEKGGSAAAALAWEADCIVTRNTSDYRHSPVPTLSPAAFLRRTIRPRSGER